MVSANQLLWCNAQLQIMPGPETSMLCRSYADPNAPETSLIPTSPRSVEACFRMGVDPVELQYHPPDYFKRPGEDEDIARLRYEKNETVRQVGPATCRQKRSELCHVRCASTMCPVHTCSHFACCTAATTTGAHPVADRHAQDAD